MKRGYSLLRDIRVSIYLSEENYWYTSGMQDRHHKHFYTFTVKTVY